MVFGVVILVQSHVLCRDHHITHVVAITEPMSYLCNCTCTLIAIGACCYCEPHDSPATNSGEKELLG